MKGCLLISKIQSQISNSLSVLNSKFIVQPQRDFIELRAR